MSGSREEENLKCYLCNVDFITYQEFDEHGFSLMHHLKMDAKQKGKQHSCSLCFISVTDLKTYVNHLNGRKHQKLLAARRQTCAELSTGVSHSSKTSGSESMSADKRQNTSVVNDFRKESFLQKSQDIVSNNNVHSMTVGKNMQNHPGFNEQEMNFSSQCPSQPPFIRGRYFTQHFPDPMHSPGYFPQQPFRPAGDVWLNGTWYDRAPLLPNNQVLPLQPPMPPSTWPSDPPWKSYRNELPHLNRDKRSSEQSPLCNREKNNYTNPRNFRLNSRSSSGDYNKNDSKNTAGSQCSALPVNDMVKQLVESSSRSVDHRLQKNGNSNFVKGGNPWREGTKPLSSKRNDKYTWRRSNYDQHKSHSIDSRRSASPKGASVLPTQDNFTATENPEHSPKIILRGREVRNVNVTLGREAQHREVSCGASPSAIHFDASMHNANKTSPIVPKPVKHQPVNSKTVSRNTCKGKKDGMSKGSKIKLKHSQLKILERLQLSEKRLNRNKLKQLNGKPGEPIALHSKRTHLCYLSSSSDDDNHHANEVSKPMLSSHGEIEKNDPKEGVQDDKESPKLAKRAKDKFQKLSEVLQKSNTDLSACNCDLLSRLVNFPRTRKQQMQLHTWIKQYSQSSKKLSLPRFNLNPFSSSGDENVQGDHLSSDFTSLVSEVELSDLPTDILSSLVHVFEESETEVPITSETEGMQDVPREPEEMQDLQGETEEMEGLQTDFAVKEGLPSPHLESLSESSDKVLPSTENLPSSDTLVDPAVSHAITWIKKEPLEPEDEGDTLASDITNIQSKCAGAGSVFEATVKMEPDGATDAVNPAAKVPPDTLACSTDVLNVLENNRLQGQNLLPVADSVLVPLQHGGVPCSPRFKGVSSCIQVKQEPLSPSVEGVLSTDHDSSVVPENVRCEQQGLNTAAHTQSTSSAPIVTSGIAAVHSNGAAGLNSVPLPCEETSTKLQNKESSIISPQKPMSDLDSMLQDKELSIHNGLGNQAHLHPQKPRTSDMDSKFQDKALSICNGLGNQACLHLQKSPTSNLDSKLQNKELPICNSLGNHAHLHSQKPPPSDLDGILHVSDNVNHDISVAGENLELHVQNKTLPTIELQYPKHETTEDSCHSPVQMERLGNSDGTMSEHTPSSNADVLTPKSVSPESPVLPFTAQSPSHTLGPVTSKTHPPSPATSLPPSHHLVQELLNISQEEEKMRVSIQKIDMALTQMSRILTEWKNKKLEFQQQEATLRARRLEMLQVLQGHLAEDSSVSASVTKPTAEPESVNTQNINETLNFTSMPKSKCSSTNQTSSPHQRGTTADFDEFLNNENNPLNITYIGSLNPTTLDIMEQFAASFQQVDSLSLNHSDLFPFGDISSSNPMKSDVQGFCPTINGHASRVLSQKRPASKTDRPKACKKASAKGRFCSRSKGGSPAPKRQKNMRRKPEDTSVVSTSCEKDGGFNRARNKARELAQSPKGQSSAGETSDDLADPFQEKNQPLNCNAKFGEFEAHSSAVIDIKIFNGYIYTCSSDFLAKKFDLQTHKEVMVYKGHTKMVSSIEVFPSHGKKYVYTTCHDGFLRCFDEVKGCCMKALEVETPIICSTVNWGKIYLGLHTGYVLVYNLVLERKLEAFMCSKMSISRLTTTTEGSSRMLCVAAYDGCLTIRNAKTGLLVRCLELHLKPPCFIQMSVRIAYVTTTEKKILVFDIASGTMVSKIHCASSATGLHIQDNYVLCCSFDGLIRCYNKQGLSLHSAYYGAGKKMVMCMGACQNLIVTGNRRGQVSILKFDPKVFHHCQFSDCGMILGRIEDMHHHLKSAHLPELQTGVKCQWRGCRASWTKGTTVQEKEDHLYSHAGSEDLQEQNDSPFSHS